MTNNSGQPGLQPDPGSSSPPFILPDHELLRCIGQGSYGEVWAARSVLGAFRAVKVVRRSSFQDARPYEREFSGILRVEPLSRAHEGLIDILHVGRHEPEGFFYYVMELADAVGDDHGEGVRSVDDIQRYTPRTLAHELEQRARLGFDECVQLGLRVSGALSHIHQNGLVHRDVKPSNILYVGGVPRLGDIGLVGEAGESRSYVGTEGYIPPEGPGTAQADVFGLGKVLYEACTGQDRKDFPRLPVDLGDAAARVQLAELNEVILKACDPDPHRRYATAEQMHADLALLHRGQSVLRQRRRQRRGRLARVGLNLAMLATGVAAGALWSPVQRGTADAGAPHADRGPRPVDLARFYNASLSDSWLQDVRGNDLSSLATNWQQLGPTWFQPAGIIQLRGAYTLNHGLRFPATVEGIPLHQTCRRLSFLQGTVWYEKKGAHVGSYVVHYASGRRDEIPLQYGFEVQNWWWDPTLPDGERLVVAWIGTNAATHSSPTKLRLYSTTWTNPHPSDPITRLDFVTTGSAACPFLLAITAE